jgi:acyl-coenzyme A thioesterase PaaI-like protein
MRDAIDPSLEQSSAFVAAAGLQLESWSGTEFLRAHRTGRLDVVATPIYQGRTGQLWQCDLTREDGKLVARGQVRLQNVER